MEYFLVGCHESTDNILGRDVIRGLPYGTFIVRGVDTHRHECWGNETVQVSVLPPAFHYIINDVQLAGGLRAVELTVATPIPAALWLALSGLGVLAAIGSRLA